MPAGRRRASTSWSSASTAWRRTWPSGWQRIRKARGRPIARNIPQPSVSRKDVADLPSVHWPQADGVTVECAQHAASWPTRAPSWPPPTRWATACACACAWPAPATTPACTRVPGGPVARDPPRRFFTRCRRCPSTWCATSPSTTRVSGMIVVATALIDGPRGASWAWPTWCCWSTGRGRAGRGGRRRLQQRGVGKLLTEVIASLAMRQGATHLYAELLDDNVPDAAPDGAPGAHGAHASRTAPHSCTPASARHSATRPSFGGVAWSQCPATPNAPPWPPAWPP